MYTMNGTNEIRGKQPASFKKAMGLLPLRENEVLRPGDYWTWAIPASTGYKLPSYKADRRAVCGQ